MIFDSEKGSHFWTLYFGTYVRLFDYTIVKNVLWPLLYFIAWSENFTLIVVKWFVMMIVRNCWHA